MPKKLRDLDVKEISGVTKGANPGAKVMILKRDDGTPDIAKSAAMSCHNIWQGMVETVRLMEKCSEQDAIDILLTTKTGQEAFAVSKSLSAADVIKALPQNDKVSRPEIGGRVTSQTQHSGHGVGHPSPDDPFDTVASTADGAETLARLRRGHVRQVAHDYYSAVKEKMSSGASESEAHQHALATVPGAKMLSAADMINAQRDAQSDADAMSVPPTRGKTLRQLKRPGETAGSNQNQVA
jgi:hypothetical protein